MKTRVGKLVCLLLCAASLGAAFAEEAAVPPVSWILSPSFMIPLGSGTTYYDLGGGGRFSVEYAFPAVKGLSLQAGLLYDWQALTWEAGSISDMGVLAGAGWTFPLTGGLSARAFADAGYCFGVKNGDSLSNGGGSAVLDAGAGLSYAFTPNLALRLDLSYQHYMGMFGGLNASLAFSVTPPAPRQAVLPSRPTRLELGDITLQSVFPIFHTWYDQHPVGTVVVKNTGKASVTNLTLSFNIKEYMDGPKECATIAEIKPGEAREVPLYALFNGSILGVTEATKSISEISASFTEEGEKQSQSRTATIRVYNRNAMSWDDDRKAAAFVSGKDPWVQDFATGVAAMVKQSMNANVSRNLQLAMALHDASRLYGLSYSPSPTSPFSQTSTHPEIVDYVRFPRQTLVGRAGDCSDLSILYASFFESMGKETAFITVPGHIFMAVCLDVSPEEAKSGMTMYEELIIREGKVWLPIETTMRDKGFLDAWREGARDWKKSSAEGTAAFYPIHEAWTVYEPVGLATDETTVKVPAADLVLQTFTTELSGYVQQELHARVASINETMSKKGQSAKRLNDRGVMYAKFGSMELAEKDFQGALKLQAEYAPALINLGNMARLKSDDRSALAYYQRAAKVAPNNARLQINLALTASTLGDDTTASAAYQAAQGLDPELAADYAFMGERGSAGTRASEAGLKAVLWDDEQE